MYTKQEVDDNFTAPSAHPITFITGLQSALDAKQESSSIPAIVDGLASSAANQPLSANQGLVLKGLIDSINALLVSDDVSLDQLQEIVTYIKANRSDIDALGVSSIVGLQSALNAITGDITTINTVLDNKATKADLANVGASTATLMKFGAF